MKRLALVVGVVALAAGSAAPVRAAGPSAAVVAGPGAGRVGQYTTSIVPVRPGDSVSLVNGDVLWHDVVASDDGADDRPWCVPLDTTKPESATNPRQYPLGSCPLFAADAAPGAGGTSAVRGLENVVAGRVYAFHCSLVPGMRGSFFVL